jgi:hypothetical protein
MCDNDDFIPKEACRILRTLPGGMGARNLYRLLGCSIARLVWPLMDARSQRAVEVAERFALGTAILPQLARAHDEANEVVREREQASWEQELSADEQALEYGAWAAWGVTTMRGPWKPFTVAFDAVANAMRLRGLSEREIEAVLCQTLRDALAAPFSAT